MNRSDLFSTIKEWCDALISYIITETKDKRLFGALLCPACSVVHGREADLCYPLCFLYSETKDDKYLQAADMLLDWSENNVKTGCGIWKNDVLNLWQGTSAFSAIAFGNILLHFGDKIPEKQKARYLRLFTDLTASCDKLFANPDFHPNINYIAAYTALCAVNYALSGDENYRKSADLFSEKCVFDKDGLLMGEGLPHTGITEKGCDYVDIGYNVEESLPLLMQYAALTKNREKCLFYIDKMKKHLHFLLPDGSLDNSFGSRHNKWTGYGSRTSDGMGEFAAFAYPFDETFLSYAYKNAEFMRSCSHSGLLYGGRDAYASGEAPCLHFGFTHVKGLTSLYLCGKEPQTWADFPRFDEKAKSFLGGNVYTLSAGDYTATVSASDVCFYKGAENGGGNITLLFNKKKGHILAATMHEYIPSEPLNMNYKRSEDDTFCCTPRFVSGQYSSDCDKSVRLVFSEKALTAESSMISITYRITESGLTVELLPHDDGEYRLPIVLSPSEKATFSEEKQILSAGKISLSATSPITLPSGTDYRTYNQVGGFSYLPVVIRLEKNKLTIVNIA